MKTCPKCGNLKSLGAVLCRDCRAAMKGVDPQIPIEVLQQFKVDRLLARIEVARNGPRVLDDHRARQIFGISGGVD